MTTSTSRPALRDFVTNRWAFGGPWPTWYICQPAGGVVAFFASRIGLTPNVVTGLALALGLAGTAALATSHFLLAGSALVTAFIFDCADGQLARSTGRTSPRGAWLDVMADATLVVAVTVSVQAQTMGSALGAFGAFVLGAGRVAALTTSTLAKRTLSREPFVTLGWRRVAR